jgi:DNA-binding winged helix-turn-helix (wHTH) protein
LLKHGSPVSLGQKCVALLEALLAAEGRAVSKSALMEAAWQTENIEESNLAVQIAWAGQNLAKNGSLRFSGSDTSLSAREKPRRRLSIMNQTRSFKPRLTGHP